MYNLRIRSASRLRAPSVWEACCVVLANCLRSDHQTRRVAICLPAARHGRDLHFFRSTRARSRRCCGRGRYRSPACGPTRSMVHAPVFQVMKMIASFIGHKTHLELVGWHNDDKLMLLGTPQQAVLPAAHSFGRARGPRRCAQLSLDREARDGRRPARTVDRLLVRRSVRSCARWCFRHTPRSNVAQCA